MGLRDIALVEGEVYHIFSKSIAEYQIFRNEKEYERMKSLISYYRMKNPPVRFSLYEELADKKIFAHERRLYNKNYLAEVIGYVLMPTHIHLILRQLSSQGISIMMRKILDSYSRYFNIKIKRKGPLWESRFNRIVLKSDEELLHLTRYIHLNPVTAYLAERPEDWPFSSYNEYLGNIRKEGKICNFSEILDIDPQSYKDFVISQIDYQRELAKARIQSEE